MPTRRASSRLAVSRLLPAIVSLALCIVAISCVAARGAVSVDIDAPHAEIWNRFYDDLPTCWKTDDTIYVRVYTRAQIERLVRSLGDDQSSNSQDNDSDVDGCYQSDIGEQSRPTITLRDDLAGREAGLVFTHEYGHYVWDEKLTRAERRAYFALWRSQKHARRLVTPYAAESPEEGFAEAFAHYVRAPKALRSRDAASLRFLTDAANRLDTAAAER